MSELGPDARSILDAARGGDEPTDADRKRVHTSLARRIGVGAAILGTTTATTASAGGATLAGVSVGVSTFTKAVVIVVGFVGVIGGGTYVVRRMTAPKPQPAHVATTNDTAKEPVKETTKDTASPAPTNAPVIATPEPTVAPDPAPTPVVKVTASPMPIVAPTSAPTTAPSAKKSAFDDELAAMQQAQAVLGSDPQKALTLLDAQSKQFPSGAFAQERAGMRVVALCELGRPEARAQAEAFLAAHPQSPMALRIRSACKIGE
jgi:hypothetical protein